MKNRFLIIKHLFPDYLILIRKKDKLLSFDIDNMIFKIINYKTINDLNKKHINYLILDNLEIELKKEYNDNRYKEYLMKTSLIKLMERMINFEKENNFN
jgi:hypothetical protein